MLKNRKSIKDVIYHLRSILNRHRDLKTVLAPLEGETNYQQSLDFYTRSIAKLTAELDKLPIGYKYTGTFYIKKPYTVPTEYEKIVGEAFMREDLVSWTIFNEERACDIYKREIFKEPNYNSKIEREEAELVFSNATAKVINF